MNDPNVPGDREVVSVAVHQAMVLALAGAGGRAIPDRPRNCLVVRLGSRDDRRQMNMDRGNRRLWLFVLGAVVAITAASFAVSSVTRSLVLPFSSWLWIQLLIGLLIIGYGVQAVIFR